MDPRQTCYAMKFVNISTVTQVLLSTILLIGTILYSPPVHADSFAWSGAVSLDAKRLESPSSEERLEGVLALQKHPIQWTRTFLMGRLSDNDVRVRIAAGGILAAAGVKEAAPMIAPWLARPLPAEKIAAADLLARLGVKGHTKSLIRSLGDSDVNVRVAVIGALGTLGGKEIIGPLVSMMDNSSPKVRFAAAKQLSTIDDSRIVQALLGCLNDSSIDTRLICIKATGKSRAPEALRPLTMLLASRDARTQVAAIRALGELAMHVRLDHSWDWCIAINRQKQAEDGRLILTENMRWLRSEMSWLAPVEMVIKQYLILQCHR